MAQILLRREEVQRRLGVKKTTLFRMVKDGEFPPAIIVTGQVMAWPEADCETFVAHRIAASRGGEA